MAKADDGGHRSHRTRKDAADPVQEQALRSGWAQQGDAITTSTGVPVDDTDNTLRAGPRGPALLDDFHMREKLMHFDHERIPERVVHARGAGAHGHFRVYESLEQLTRARVFADPSVETPVFVRFSTVAGSRGSADTARDVRGFATKFYTPEGVWDLVGNNIPVFFIQDGIKFPDLIHAAKPEPDREIPQAQTAHDTFWDFASLATETTHMLMWIMSDRAIPRSLRTMQGFGVHTFRLINEAGVTTLVKFHWRPLLGTHSLLWEECQKLGGFDPDFHRRDLWQAIDAGAFPEWELGIQVMPDTPDQTFEGIDLLDPTKLVPEELAPVRPIGRMVLDRNPTNFFAETEQVAFCTAHVPPGIDFTDDPLLQARNFSYFDTQLTRLGGPNFDQLPINRPHSPVNTNERDGFGQQAVHEGVAAYSPNSVGGGCPFHVGAEGYVHAPRTVEGPRVRQRPLSFDDHFSQASLFWNSMSEVERGHIVEAFSFELAKCERPEIRKRMTANLARVDAKLAGSVAARLGVEAPAAGPVGAAGASAALTLVATEPGPIDGRTVGLVVGDGIKPKALKKLRSELAGASVLTIGPLAGGTGEGRSEVAVDRALFTAQSVEFDAILVADTDAPSEAADQSRLNLLLDEAYRHYKPIAAWGRGRDRLQDAGVPDVAPGVVVAEAPDEAFTEKVTRVVGLHRHWDRTVPS